MSSTVWYYSRVCLEGFHAIFWIFLIGAALACPSSLLWLPILFLAAIPVGWTAAGACPISLLENYLCPISYSGDTIATNRNRAGVTIRKHLRIDLKTWDSLLLYLTCLLAVVYGFRVLYSLS